MILTTHAITGAAVASVLPQNPILGFAAGFASHFLLDMIPHWDYKLRSAKHDFENPLDSDIALNEDFLFDLMKISADGIFGVATALLLFSDLSSLLISPVSLISSSIFWGISGALLPDFLQFVYFKWWRREPLKSLQRFHQRIQKIKVLKNRPVLGASLQAALIIVIVSVSKWIAS